MTKLIKCMRNMLMVVFVLVGFTVSAVSVNATGSTDSTINLLEKTEIDLISGVELMDGYTLIDSIDAIGKLLNSPEFIANATGALPGLSSQKYIQAYAITNGRIDVYTDSSLKTKKSGWYIDGAADEIRIVKVTSNAIQCFYPIGSGKWTSQAQWIPRSAISSFNLAANNLQIKVSTAQIDTFKKVNGAKYGYVGKQDTVFVLGSVNGYTQLVYPLSNNNFKLAWIKSSDAQKYLADQNSQGSVTSTSGSMVCPVRNYSETNHQGLNGTSWAYYNSNNRSNNRHWHLGIDLMVSGDKYSSRTHNESADRVYSLSDGTVKATGYNSSNGNYVIIQHTISGKTVYSFYGHLYSVNVKAGAKVSTNSVIGWIGWSGGSPGNGKHVHFAIVDKLDTSGGYYGYTNTNILSQKANKTSYSNIQYYNPWYVINYKKLP